MNELNKARKLAEKHKAQVAKLSEVGRALYAYFSGEAVETPKAKRPYKRKSKAEATPKPAKKEAKAGNGGDGLAFPKPGQKRGRGRPRKVHSMIPAPAVVEGPAEA